MKYIDRSKENEPTILQGMAAPINGDAIDENIYGHEEVKSTLQKLQKGICCYCESRYDITGYADVEHFRPKKGWKQDKDDKELHKPGYYWLAYKWDNLLYSCNKCNRTYKKNFFPLKDPNKRFKPATLNISQEKPLLINPYEEQHPENHLDFDGPFIKSKTDEGAYSIAYYGLDRNELNEERLRIYNDINAFVDLATLAKDTPLEEQMNDGIKKRVGEKLDELMHTLMIKCNFSEYL